MHQWVNLLRQSDSYICVSKLNIIGSDNGLSPCWCQTVIWKSAEIVLISPSGTNFCEMLIAIHTFSFKTKKMLFAKWQPFCRSLNVLIEIYMKPYLCYVNISFWIVTILLLPETVGVLAVIASWIMCQLTWSALYCYRQNELMTGLWGYRLSSHDDVIKWKNFPHYWPFCMGNSLVTSEFPAQRPVTQSFDVFFICAWMNSWVNNREAGDLRCHHAHYDITVMIVLYFGHSILIYHDQDYVDSINIDSLSFQNIKIKMFYSICN